MILRIAVILIVVISSLPIQSLADDSRAPASSLSREIELVDSGKGPSFEARAGRITNLASSVYSFELGSFASESLNADIALPSYLTEIHDGGNAAWKLSLIGVSSRGVDGFGFKWAMESGLTNDCPLCQTEAQQYYLNGGVGIGFEGSHGLVAALAGVETSAWIEDGNQSLGIPVISIEAETSVIGISASLASSIAQARMKTKRESELRLECEVVDGVSLTSNLSYRTITDEDDESKLFLGLNFSAK